jgi:lipopolysaccharide export system permease protein
VDRPDLDLGFIVKILLNVLPFSLAITIPWGFLTAILLNFGRLSADNELVSFRMAGLTMGRICFSVTILAVAFSGLCGYIKLKVEPSARANLERMLPDMLYNLASKNPLALFTDKKLMEEIPQHLIYTHRNGDDLTNFQMVVLDRFMRPEVFVIAEKVDVSLDPNAEEPTMLMDLHNAYFEVKKTEDAFAEMQPYAARQAAMPVSLADLRNAQVKMKPETMQVPEILEYLDRGDLTKVDRSSLRTEMSMRLSFSLACITLGLIGVPLGVTAQRRETSVGFALSLAIGILYFLLMTIVELLREQYHLYPHFLAWVPNLIFIALGTIQFRKLSRK